MQSESEYVNLVLQAYEEKLFLGSLVYMLRTELTINNVVSKLYIIQPFDTSIPVVKLVKRCPSFEYLVV